MTALHLNEKQILHHTITFTRYLPICHHCLQLNYDVTLFNKRHSEKNLFSAVHKIKKRVIKINKKKVTFERKNMKTIISA